MRRISWRPPFQVAYGGHEKGEGAGPIVENVVEEALRHLALNGRRRERPSYVFHPTMVSDRLLSEDNIELGPGNITGEQRRFKHPLTPPSTARPGRPASQRLAGQDKRA